MRPLLKNRFPKNFFHGRLAQGYFSQTAAPQGEHSLLHRFLFQFQCRSANENQLAHLVVDFHNFVQTGTSLVAALVAGRAAFAMINFGGLHFIKRLMVEGASLVCSVESTKWPVSAAFTAISAVSKSRISPTRMMLGSCRRKARNADAKLSPICSFICTWLMPANWNSTGSSAVIMFVSEVFRRATEE